MNATKQKSTGSKAPNVQNPHEGSPMVQISTEALAAWKSQVESSFNQMKALLQVQLNSAEFRQVPRPAFPQFRRLPIEIRRMIWGEALSEPQLFIFGEVACSRSHFNDIVESCYEAAKEAKSRLDFFTTDLDRAFGSKVEFPIKHYINTHVDTIWLAFPNSLNCTLADKNIRMRCGSCLGSGYPSQQFCAEWCRKHKHKSRCPIEKLAIQSGSWFRGFMQEAGGFGGQGSNIVPRYMFSMEVLFQHRVKELLIVMGEVPLIPNEGASLVELTTNPSSHDERQFTMWQRTVEEEDIYWRDLAKRMTEQMEQYKEKLLSDEKCMTQRVMHMRLPGSYIVEEDGEFFGEGEVDAYYDHLANLEARGPTRRKELEELRLRFQDPDNIADWEVPTIRFVEAKVSNKWMAYRKRNS